MTENLIKDVESATKSLIEWLLEEDQPSVRYHTLIEILDRKKTDPDVKEARSKIGKKGWAYEILKSQKPKGFWETREPKSLEEWLNFLYLPNYLSTYNRAIVLSELGMDSSDRRIRKIADLIFEYKLRIPSGANLFNDEVCLVGNTARMLTGFGFSDDFRVKKLFNRLLEDQKEDGGWHCFTSNKGTLDCWEGLAAFGALPKSKWSRRIRRSIERGAEFYLSRKLFDDGEKRYPPWFRFHYPNHYYYDILLGLDVITSLGYVSDKRLLPALNIMKEKRQADGTWLLDRIHPDIAPGTGYAPQGKVTRFALEKEGKPSKWITLKALRVLKRVEAAS